MKKLSPSIIVFLTATSAALICFAPTARAATPTADIKANGSDGPISISPGSSVNLTWTSTDATFCSIIPTDLTGTSGSATTDSLTVGQYFILDCSGPGGYANDFVYVDVPNTYNAGTNNGNNNNNPNNSLPPTVALTVSPQNISPGDAVTLNWTSSNAYYCSASVNWSGNKDIAGSEAVYPPATNNYTLTCYSHNGQSAVAQATVFMYDQQAPPTVTISAAPSTITAGQASFLNWHSNNATSCIASDSWSGNIDTSGWLAVSPRVTTTYTVNCSNNYGTTQGSQTITVTQAASPGPASVSSQISQSASNRTLNQTVFANSVDADGLDIIEFQIRVRNTGSGLTTLTVRDALPQELYYVQGSTTIGGSASGDGITGQGLSLPSINPGEEKVIDFRAVVFSGTAVGTVNSRAILIEPSGNQKSALLPVNIRHRGTVLGVSEIPTGPEDILPWVFLAGLIGSVVIHVIIFKKGAVGDSALKKFAVKGTAHLHHDTAGEFLAGRELG